MTDLPAEGEHIHDWQREAVEEAGALTKPPQRPHHWINADGTCHAGDLFEQGRPAMPLYTFEQMEAWVAAERQAALNKGWGLGAKHMAAALRRPIGQEVKR